MKIDRLLGMVMYLLNRKVVSATTLAEKFDVSVRTIQRDINSLTMAGIPIVSFHGSSGGYGIMDNFKLDKQIMDIDDYLYIIKALKSLSSAYENDKIGKALEKVLAIVPEQNKEDFKKLNSKLSIDLSVLKENNILEESISLVENAIDQKRVIRFTYTNSKYQESMRNTEPISIIYKWYAWYMIAYCYKAEDYRLFRVSRIRDVKVLNKNFANEHTDTDSIIRKCFNSDKRKYMNIKLLCEPEIRVSVEDYFSNGNIIEKKDGQFILEISLPENEQHWLGKILSYGKKVKVIEPLRLEKIILKTVKEIERLYTE